VKRHGLLKQAIVAPIAISLAAIVAVADRPDMARATASTYQQPFAWGSVQTGKTAYAAFGSPVTGTTALSDTAPSGAGSLATRVTASGPTNKMSYLRALAGQHLFSLVVVAALRTSWLQLLRRVEVTNCGLGEPTPMVNSVTVRSPLRHCRRKQHGLRSLVKKSLRLLPASDTA